MGRGRTGLLDELAVAPWPAGLVVGLLGYAGIRHGIPAWFSRQEGPFAQAFAGQSDAFAMLAWLFLGACCVASLIAFARGRQRRRLLEAHSDLESIAALGWRDFERLVGEAFRREGYAIEETGLGGADGGIDLILRKDGKRTLVQCKQWKRRKVPVNVVREMYGLLKHHDAHAVRIAALGGYTRDAERFAAGKPIALIDGPTLLAMVREMQDSGGRKTSTVSQSNAPRSDSRSAPRIDEPQPPIAAAESGNASPTCPKCRAAMVERLNRRTGSAFWGCSTYPACAGTASI